MSGIWFGFEIAIGLVFGVILTFRILMFLRLAKYRRGNIHNAPPDLKPRLMRELLGVIQRNAEKSTPEHRQEALVMLIGNMTEPWDEETYGEITKTFLNVSKFDKHEAKFPVEAKG